MKKVLFVALSISLSASTAIGLICHNATPVMAQAAQSSAFAPTVTFENGNTLWSIENRSILSESISLRSSASFANSAGSGNKYGTSLNYNLNLEDEAKTFSPFVGAGVAYYSNGNNQVTGFAQAGIDMYFENLTLTGSVALPFSGDRGMSSSVGLGFRF
jgi:hypothetical protein